MKALTLFTYKLRFFFGPALRGKSGPLLYLFLVLVFVPTGFGLGFGLGDALKGASPAAALGVLSTPLAGFLSLGLLYSLGAGVTAHVSEFDFFMTAPVRPREYLASDLAFQFMSLFGAGGVAAAVAAFGIVSRLGLPLVSAVPLLVILFVYAFLILFLIQIFVVLRVKYPKSHVRAWTVALLVVSLAPTFSLFLPGLGGLFDAIPLPSTLFGRLGYDVVAGLPADPLALLGAAVYAGLLASVWFVLSDTYIFHGIRPSLSAGFGQVDMAARMDQQRRIMSGLGRFTTRVHVHAERGGDTSLMTRLHLLRIWRDGSILFILLFGVIAVAPTLSSGSGSSPNQSFAAPYLATEIASMLLAILALNWSYYERENLWMVLMGTRAPGAYFRGLMVSLAAIGLLIVAVFLILLQGTYAGGMTVQDAALPLAAPVAAAFAAAALLTRLKVRPSALSLPMIILLLVIPMVGFLGGLVAQVVVAAARSALGFGAAAQATVLGVFLVLLGVAGAWGVSRLGASFQL